MRNAPTVFGSSVDDVRSIEPLAGLDCLTAVATRSWQQGGESSTRLLVLAAVAAGLTTRALVPRASFTCEQTAASETATRRHGSAHDDEWRNGRRLGQQRLMQ